MGTKINSYAQVSPAATDRVLGIDVSDTGVDANGAVKSFTTQAIADLYSVTQGDVTAHQTALSITESQISDLQSYITDLVSDTTPQLGGSLDVNGNKIVSVSNGNIDIEPHGTGNVLLGNLTFDADQTVGAGQDNYVLTYDNSAGTIGLEAASSGGLIPISKTTATTTADITLTGGYSAYQVRINDLDPATVGAVLWMRVSTDGGSTWKSGASDYEWVATDIDVGGTVVNSNAADSEIVLTEGIAGTPTGAGMVTIFPGNGTTRTLIKFELMYQGNAAGREHLSSGFGVYLATTAVDAVQFLADSGNITGDFHLYGIADGDA